MKRGEWWEKAACRGMPLEVFFPPFADYRKAKRVCAGCPVKMPCLESVLDIEMDRDGCYGGYSPSERNVIRQKRMNQ